MTTRKATSIALALQAIIFLSITSCHAGWRSRASQENMLPPEKYSHYSGDYEIHRVPIDWITTICKGSLKQPGQRAIACSMWRERKCMILIATQHDLDDAGWDYDIVLQHELGHCAGWRHDY